MYNYFMITGTVCKPVEVKEVNGKRVVNLVLACTRPFPEVDGTRGTDFFKISLWEALADIANDYLKVGIPVGIKGRLHPRLTTLETGAKIYIYELIGERIINDFVTPKYENVPDEFKYNVIR